MTTFEKFITLSGAQRLAENVLVKIEESKYTHPTGSGNHHIPSGGKSGQILLWASDGEVYWDDDPLIIEVNDNKASIDTAFNDVNVMLDAHDSLIDEALAVISTLENQTINLENETQKLETNLAETAITAEEALSVAEAAKAAISEHISTEKDSSEIQVEDGKLHINGAVVEQEMQLGSWIWVNRANGNMALKWVGGDA